MPIDMKIKDIAEKALEDAGYALEEGTPTHDLFVRTGQVVFSKFVDELNNLEESWSLDNPGNIPRDQMDALMENFFIDRKNGTPNSATIRLLFSEPRSLRLPSGTRFFSGEGTTFVTPNQVNISEGEMGAQTQGDLFYVEIVVESNNPGAGTGEEIMFMESEPSGLSGIDTVETPSGGEEGESNTELLERAKNQIGVRDLVREESIHAQLNKNFPFIKRLVPIGFNDPEMDRDNPAWLRTLVEECSNAPIRLKEQNLGMMVDVWMKAQSIQSGFERLDFINDTNLSAKPIKDENGDVEEFVVSLDRLNEVPIALEQVCIIQQPGNETEESQVSQGVCQQELVVSPDPDTDEEQEIVLTIDEPEDIAYSSRATPRLRIKNVPKLGAGAQDINAVIGVHYFYSPEVATVQRFLEDPENRIITSDLLARHLVPVFIDIINLDYEGDISEDEATAILEEWIFDDEFREISDLIHLLYENDVDYVNLDTLEIKKEVHRKDGTVAISKEGEISDTLSFDDENVSNKIQTLIPRQMNINKKG